MSHSHSTNKQKPELNKTDLLEDIQHGIKLKSSKHLSNDRSCPILKAPGQSDKATSTGYTSTAVRMFNSAQVDSVKLASNGHVQNKFGTNALRPSASSSNIASSCKPPILRPKPKIPPSVSALNISRNNLSPHNSKITFARLSSVDRDSANARPADTLFKSSIESFATMKRSHGKKFLQQNPNICPERPRSNSFQQNRLVISSLFGNGLASQVGLKKNSLIIQDLYDSHDDDGKYAARLAHKGEDVIRNAFEPGELHQKMVQQHHASNNGDSQNVQVVKQQLIGNGHSSKSARPTPPLPARAPPTSRYEREKATRYHPISFEDQFKFHSERDFPRPHAFAGHRKFYQSMSSKNPANQHRSAPLVTTV